MRMTYSYIKHRRIPFLRDDAGAVEYWTGMKGRNAPANILSDCAVRAFALASGKSYDEALLAATLADRGTRGWPHEDKLKVAVSHVESCVSVLRKGMSIDAFETMLKDSGILWWKFSKPYCRMDLRDLLFKGLTRHTAIVAVEGDQGDDATHLFAVKRRCVLDEANLTGMSGHDQVYAVWVRRFGPRTKRPMLQSLWGKPGENI